MKGGDVILSPAGILLPLKSLVSVIHVRIDRSCFKAYRCYYRLKGGTGTQLLPESVIKRHSFVFIQAVPKCLGHSIYKVAAVE